MIYIILFFLIPYLLTELAKRFPAMHKLGIVSFCYIVGVLMGNIPGVQVPEEPLMKVIETLVPLFIPMLLFQTDWSIWKKSGAKMLQAFFLGVVAVVIACIISFFLFKSHMQEAQEYTAMMSGIYTGGTMNMSSIGMSLNVSNESFILLNLAEMLMGGVWLLFLLAFSKRFFGKLLPGKSSNAVKTEKATFDERVYWPGSLYALLLSIAMLGASVGISKLITGTINEMVVILSITTMGILASTITRIKNWKGSFGMGNYLLYVFCIAVGSLASIQKMIEASGVILLFVFCIMAITLMLHVIFCKVFKIDVDTFIISSTAGLYGPAFIAPVAKGIKNPSIIPLGIAISIVGLAIGNYCGLLLFQLLG